ncbi:MAG: sensor histidine kinase [Gammaproteobacteria bacterium]
MITPKNAVNDFSAVLASSIHDIKNSMSHVRELLAGLAKHKNFAENPQFRQLEIEANRMNASLMQLLILYKIDSSLFKPMIDEYPAHDLLADVAAQQQNLLAMSRIDLSIECPEDLFCYCDSALIDTALNSIVNNAQRFCRKHIILSAEAAAGDGIRFSVEDDGEGYPEALAGNADPHIGAGELHTGNTGLGLIFAATIAQLHSKGEQRGYITTDNQSRLGGARFSLFLP